MRCLTGSPQNGIDRKETSKRNIYYFPVHLSMNCAFEFSFRPYESRALTVICSVANNGCPLRWDNHR